jgi:GT2 family glycosyltransferase
LDLLDHDDKLAQFVYHPEPLSPPTARQIGTLFGSSRYLFFLDNHCMVDSNYFTRAVEQMDSRSLPMLHSTTKFHSGAPLHYEYILQLENNFWATSLKLKPQSKTEPYRIAIGGHGGFAVRRDVWNEVGGYWTGFTGYGGEESYFDLKMWMLGYEVWQDPKMLHHHHAGQRSYHRKETDEYFINMMMAANIIGGTKWIDKIYDNFSEGSKVNSGKSMFDLYMTALDRSAERAREFAARRVRTLDEQLTDFITKDVSH